MVEKQSVESYPATGGKMMLLSGLNFLPDSKVVFVEKAQGKRRATIYRPSNFLNISFKYLYVSASAFVPQSLLPSK